MDGTYYIIGFLSLTFIVGLLMWIKAGRMNYKRDKRNFENTNSAGVVGYKDYDEYSKSHNKQSLIGCLGNLGGIIAGLSAVALAFFIYMLINRGY